MYLLSWFADSLNILQDTQQHNSTTHQPIDLVMGDDTEAFVQNTLDAFSSYYDKYINERPPVVSIYTV